MPRSPMLLLEPKPTYRYLYGAHPDWWKAAPPRGALALGLLLLGVPAGLAWV